MSVVLKRMGTLLKIISAIVLLSAVLMILSTCERFDYIRVIIIETGEATSITPISAEINGEILDPGESTITQYGHCWSKNENPTTELSTKTHTHGAIGRGSYKSTLKDLSPDTRYYVRAYATNSQGTVYSDQDEFFTARGKPVAEFYAIPLEIMEGDSVEFVDQSSNMPTDWHWDFGDLGTSGSQIPVHKYSKAGTYTVSLMAINSYGSDTKTRENYISVYPVQIAPVPDFTASRTTIMVGESVQFTDHSSNTPTGWFWEFGDGGTSTEQNPSHVYSAVGLYPVSLTASNSYGENKIIKDGLITVIEKTVETGIYTDIRDGHEYKWVKIGGQIWMAENLAYLPFVSPLSAFSFTERYYYVYDYEGTIINDAEDTYNYRTYGVLYNWPAAMSGFTSSTVNPSNVQGICSDGWHLPSLAEWNELIDYLGGDSQAIGAMKEAGIEHWSSSNTGVTNISGFTALPGGGAWYIESTDSNYLTFRGLNNQGFWWTTNEDDANLDKAFILIMGYDAATVNKAGDFKSAGNSVRCVKDGGSLKKQLPGTIDDIPVIPKRFK
jgi:uncharacterized protein (TIGR02145 family)